MNLREVLEACGARPGERFQVASIWPNKKDRAPPNCAAFVFPVECSAGDTWAAAESANGWNVYLCGNPTLPGASGKQRMSVADVAVERLLLFDVDPEGTPDDPDGLDPGKRALCVAAAEAVSTETGGAHVDSGRGRQVWIQHGPGVDRKALIRGLRQKHERGGVQVDSTWPAHGLMRLPGYVNRKSGEVARLVSVGTRVLSEADVVALGLPEPKDDDDIGGGEIPPADFGPPDMTLVKGRVKTIWDEPKFCPDRSTRDALFVLECLRDKISDADACKLLFALPKSKAKDDKRGEGYWQSTIRWAKKEFTKEEKLRSDIDAIQVGDERKPNSVDLLTQAMEDDPTHYEKTIKRLKELGVRIGPLEADIKKNAKKRGLGKKTVGELEKTARHAHQEKRSVGWWLRNGDSWIYHPFGEFRSALDGMGLPASKIVAKLIEDAWTIVNEPFKPEDLSDRRWNKDSAQLKFPHPKPGSHPMWDQVLRVLGRGLDAAVARSEWCRVNNITTGASYLVHWTASLIQRPEIKLPWLFFYGLENVGKSTFWESLSLLFASGFTIANEAIENKGGFNGELAGKILCVVDDLPIPLKALKKIKPWVSGEHISIHAKGATPYTIANCTHWIQTGNKIKDCPVSKGDTRITICQVTAAEGTDRRSKLEILRLCGEESEAFTHTLKTQPLPPTFERMGIVMLETQDKRDQQTANQSALERWLERSYPSCLTLDDEKLVATFVQTLGCRDAYDWSPPQVLADLPTRFRSERRVIFGVLSSLTKRPTFRCQASDLLEWIPECQPDWASASTLGKFLAKLSAKPLAGLKIKKVRHRGTSYFRFTKLVPTPPTPVATRGP